jgi:aspartate/methionine/tyrosine aminotransferase
VTGFFAESDLTPNRIELARRQMPDYIDLTSSNPTQQGLLFPTDILEAAMSRYVHNRHYTPDAHGSLPARQYICQYYANRTPAVVLEPDDLFLTASTSESYSLLFSLLTAPGDNVLAPAVSYPLFEYLAAIYHIELRPYALDEARHWRIDAASLFAQVDQRTRAILVVSPHNPTGMVLQHAIPAFDRLHLPIISDEVFAEFTYQALTTPPIGALHPQLPVFHLNGISKMFALPDLKLGWIALNQAARQYTERLELLNDTFLSGSALSQALVPDLFSAGWPFVQQMVARVRENIDLALTILSQSSHIHLQPPDGGYYLFPSISGWADEEELVLYLLSGGVLVHPGYFFSYERGIHIVISCLTEPDVLRQGLERIVELLG